MFPMTDEEFEDAVQEALDGIPERFMEALENVAIMVQDEPEEYQLDEVEAPAIPPGSGGRPELLGLYEGVSLPERADGYDMDVPDMITIFKGPHERMFNSRDEVVTEARKTVIHEIGHYFGLDDARLHEMGY